MAVLGIWEQTFEFLFYWRSRRNLLFWKLGLRDFQSLNRFFVGHDALVGEPERRAFKFVFYQEVSARRYQHLHSSEATCERCVVQGSEAGLGLQIYISFSCG